MISIIGAGPAGGYLGSLLKEEAEIFEEHKEVGKPIQCSGILTSSIKELIPLKEEFIENKIERIKLISPNREEIEFKLKEPELIVDRERFDKYLIGRAQDKGVKLFLNSKLKDILIGDKIKLKFQNKEKETDVLVGADGVKSLVGKRIGAENKEYKIGHQYIVKGDYEKDLFKVYFNAKNGFGWIVPESKTKARIGIAGKKGTLEIFQEFLKKNGIEKKNFLEARSGLIPVYDPKRKINKGNVYLVGDAAGQVKATTLGGIVYGMRGAKILAEVLNSKKGNYEKLLRKEIGRELWLHYKADKFLQGLDEKSWDRFIEILRKINLGKFNRDRPFSGLKLFLKPSLIGFVTKELIKRSSKPGLS